MNNEEFLASELSNKHWLAQVVLNDFCNWMHEIDAWPQMHGLPYYTKEYLKSLHEGDKMTQFMKYYAEYERRRTLMIAIAEAQGTF